MAYKRKISHTSATNIDTAGPTSAVAKAVSDSVGKRKKSVFLRDKEAFSGNTDKYNTVSSKIYLYLESADGYFTVNGASSLYIRCKDLYNTPVLVRKELNSTAVFSLMLIRLGSGPINGLVQGAANMVPYCSASTSSY